jgi:hypothetical protein
MATRPRPERSPARSTAARVESVAIILDRDQHRVREALQVDAACRRARMPGHVRQGFLDDTIRGDLDVRHETCVHAVLTQIHMKAMPFAPTSNIPLDGGRQSQVIKERRMKERRQVPNRRKRSIGDRSRIVQDVCPPARRVNRTLRDCQLDLDRGEHLPSARTSRAPIRQMAS